MVIALVVITMIRMMMPALCIQSSARTQIRKASKPFGVLSISGLMRWMIKG
jgi:hypothetical protein